MKLKEKDIVKIFVKNKAKMFYFPNYLHSQIGYVWQGPDEEHIYIKPFIYDDFGVPFVGSVCRYTLDDITIEKVEME